MSFREVLDFLSHDDMTEAVASPSDPSLLSSLEALIGMAYRYTLTFDKTPEEAMLLILWTLFYFVQQDHVLTDKDDDVVLRALAAAQANAAFCKKDEEESK